MSVLLCVYRFVVQRTRTHHTVGVVTNGSYLLPKNSSNNAMLMIVSIVIVLGSAGAGSMKMIMVAIAD